MRSIICSISDISFSLIFLGKCFAHSWMWSVEVSRNRCIGIISHVRSHNVCLQNVSCWCQMVFKEGVTFSIKMHPGCPQILRCNHCDLYGRFNFKKFYKIISLGWFLQTDGQTWVLPFASEATPRRISSSLILKKVWVWFLWLPLACWKDTLGNICGNWQAGFVS